MWSAVKTFFSSGLAFIFVAILSFSAGLERDDGAWISFTLAAIWGYLGIASFTRYYREWKARQAPR